MRDLEDKELLWRAVRKHDIDAAEEIMRRKEVLLERLGTEFMGRELSDDEKLDLAAETLSLMFNATRSEILAIKDVSGWILVQTRTVLEKRKASAERAEFSEEVLRAVSVRCPLPNRREPLPPCGGPCPLLTTEMERGAAKAAALRLGLKEGAIFNERKKCKALAEEIAGASK